MHSLVLMLLPICLLMFLFLFYVLNFLHTARILFITGTVLIQIQAVGFEHACQQPSKNTALK